MVSMTLAVPEELKQRMDEFPEINWSAVARQAFVQKLHDMELLKEFTSKSKLTEKDALELGRKVNKSLVKRFKDVQIV